MKWKWIGAGLWIGIIAVISTAMILDHNAAPDTPNSGKTVEVKNSVLLGYSKGKKVWEINSPEIWATQSKFIYRAKRAFDGQVWDSQGHLILKNLSADEIEVYTQPKTLQTKGNIHALFLKRPLPDSDPALNKPIEIKANRFRFYSDLNKAFIDEQLSITQGDRVLSSKATAVADIEQNTVSLSGAFTLSSPDLFVSGNRLLMVVDADTLELSEQIRGFQKAQKKFPKEMDPREKKFRKKTTFFQCDALRLTPIVSEAIGAFKLNQKGLQVSAQQGYYDKKKNTYTLSGDVTIYIERPSDFLKKPLQTNNDSLQESVSKPVTLTCQFFELNLNTLEMTAKEKVVFKQKKQSLSCDRMIWQDKTQTLRLDGHIHITNRDHETIKAAHLTYELETENMEAAEQIETQFIVKKRKKS